MGTPNIFDKAHDLFAGIEIKAAPDIWAEECPEIEGYLVEDDSRFDCLVEISAYPKGALCEQFFDEYEDYYFDTPSGRHWVWKRQLDKSRIYTCPKCGDEKKFSTYRRLNAFLEKFDYRRDCGHPNDVCPCTPEKNLSAETIARFKRDFFSAGE